MTHHVIANGANQGSHRWRAEGRRSPSLRVRDAPPARASSDNWCLLEYHYVMDLIKKQSRIKLPV